MASQQTEYMASVQNMLLCVVPCFMADNDSYEDNKRKEHAKSLSKQLSNAADKLFKCDGNNMAVVKAKSRLWLKNNPFPSSTPPAQQFFLHHQIC